jgi:hypothetical protein
MTLFAELVQWGDLGKVVLVGLLGGVGLVATWGFLLLGVERTLQVRSGERPGAIAGYGAMAVVGGVATLALLVLGLWAITHK